MIHIIDLGVGNVTSLSSAFYRLGIPVRLAREVKDLKNACKVVLPGVGSFQEVSARLKYTGIDREIKSLLGSGEKQFLGICSGMQLITESSTEGVGHGLGLLKGRVSEINYKVQRTIVLPHMGWNNVVFKKPSKILDGLGLTAKFYFLHSFACELEDAANVVAETYYGTTFPSVIEAENIFGVQFHPERSHKQGLKVLQNFCEIS